MKDPTDLTEHHKEHVNSSSQESMPEIETSSFARRALYGLYRTSRGVPEGATDAACSAPYLRRLVEKHFPVNRNAKILDLGCGDGSLVSALKSAGFASLQGVDVSEEQVRAAVLAGVMEIRHGDLFDALAETDSDSLDVVVCFDVIEHLPKADLWELIPTVLRVLKKGGRWIIHVPNAEGLFGARVRYADVTHETAFTRESIEQALRAYGFTQVRCYEDVPVVHGVLSALRRVLWECLRLGLRLIWLIETGDTGKQCIFSQNLLAVAIR